MISSGLGVAAPIITLALTAIIVLSLTVAGGAMREAQKACDHLAVITLLGFAIALWLLLANPPGIASAFTFAVVRDGIAVVFGSTILLGAMLTVLFALPYLREHELARGEFLALLLLSTTGMLTLVMAGDLMTFFIGLETMSLALYVLVGYRRTSTKSQEAALKYFVYGAFASAFALFGIALLYGELGRLSGQPGLGFAELCAALREGELSPLGQIAVVLILAALAFKVAAAPFHLWAPDVYEGAPTPATGFMAVCVKAAAVAGLCRFLASTVTAKGPASAAVIHLFEVLAVLTMLVGNLVAIRQNDLKRMLAYSSIAHAGYLLVGVVAFVAKPDGTSLFALGYYLLGYAGMTLGAFGVALCLERREDRGQHLALERLVGTAHRHPALGLAMAIFMFSLAGVPPTAGFFGKLALFSSAIEAGRVGVVVLAVIASAIGAYYYLRVLVVMYMRGKASSFLEITRSGWLSSGLLLASVATLILGIAPQRLLSFARTWLAYILG